MPEPTVTYLSPAWGLVPPKEHASHGVHVRVKFDDDSGPVDVVHNFGLAYGSPVPENDWAYPLVVVTDLAGGPAAPRCTVVPKDGNTLTLARVAAGPGTSLYIDLWIYRHKPSGGWFS